MLETLAYLFFQSDVCVCRKQDTGVSNIKIFTEKLDSQFRPIHVSMFTNKRLNIIGIREKIMSKNISPFFLTISI